MSVQSDRQFFQRVGSRGIGPTLGDGTARGGLLAPTVYAPSAFASPSGAAAQQIESASGTVPTVFVAASDAREKSKDAADFVCDGTNDEDVIQQGISELADMANYDGFGSVGRLMLSGGVFNLDTAGGAGITLDAATILQGQGWGTELRLAAGAPNGDVINAANGPCVIRDLSIHGNRNNNAGWVGNLILMQTTGGQIENVLAHSSADDGLQAAGNNPDPTFIDGGDVNYQIHAPVMLRGVWCLGCDGVAFSVTARCEASLCHAVDCGQHGWEIFSNHTHLIGCSATNCGSASFAGIADFGTNTVIDACRATSCAGDGFELGGSSGVVSACLSEGNREGFRLSGGSYSLDACYAYICGQHGYHLAGSSDNVVEGCVAAFCGQATANTYDGVLLDGNADDNHITGVRVQDTRHRYGINIAASTCNDNVVWANNVRGGFTTAGVNDAGTGTITTLPAAGNWT